ncbi:MAG: hypothetical protein ABF261_05800 [Candidatus Arcticimaribacter sp.]
MSIQLKEIKPESKTEVKELLETTLSEFLNQQKKEILVNQQMILSIEVMDYISIEQALVIVGTKDEEHIRKLLDHFGVRRRTVQGLSAGKGNILRYSKEDIQNKIIVRPQDYIKVNLKN